MEQDVQGRGKWTGEMKYLRWVGRNEHPEGIWKGFVPGTAVVPKEASESQD